MAAPTVAGVDEAGRGPVLGPLVVACAVTTDPDGLRRIGVRDSKKLSPAGRLSLGPVLERTLQGSALITVDAARLDVLMAKYTLNEIEVDMFAEATVKAAESRGGDGLDVLQLDAADTDEAAFGRYVVEAIAARKPGLRVGTVLAKHRGDSLFPAVGAASVLAKLERDRQVRRLSQEVGQDVGSGYPSDEVTIRFLREYISAHGDVPPFCRRSWQTTTDLLNEAGLVNRRLGDYE